MKRVLSICTILAVLVGLVVFAAPNAKAPESPTATVSVAPVSTTDNPELAVKLEIQSLVAEITAAKEAGQIPNPALMARLNELLPSADRGGSLDQGGEDWANATVIPTTPYSDTGVLGATDDCVGTPYNDVFYAYTVQAAGSHTFDMCGTAGDTYLKLWKNPTGTCAAAATYTSDDVCGMAPQLSIVLAVGDVVVIECGYYSSGTPGSYLFNVSAPTPPPPGDVCATAIPIASLPYSVTGQTTQGFTNDYAPVCMSYYGSGRDVVYTFTLSTPTTVQIALTNTGDYAYPGVGLFNGCPDAGVCVAYAYNYTGDQFIPCTPLDPGVYFILVDNWPTPDFINYDLAVTECAPCEPPYNDVCANAVPVPVAPGFPAVMNGTNFCATANDCFGAGYPVVWEAFIAPECATYSVAYCGSQGVPNAFLNVFADCVCGVYYGPTSYNNTACGDGNYTLNYQLQAGTYYVPIYMSLGPLYTVTVTYIEPCPPPFICHCTDPMDGRWCNMTGGPINDVSNNSFPILVPIQYHITDVNVCLDLTHTYDGDLHIWLESPAGATVNLSVNHGGGGDNFVCTTFDDEAITPIASGIAPFTGSFIPDAPLSGFDGQNAVGTWILHIDDLYGGDFGTLNWACLTFEYDQILAVELSSFDAIAGDRSVELTWTTASETNNDYFEIVRDGEAVHRVDATNNATGSSYSWTDGNLTNGTSYTYSLAAVDMIGDRQVLATESVTPSFGAAVITEYALHQNFPNPFNPETQITYDLVDNGLVSLRVYNLMGQEVADLVNGMKDAGRQTISFNAASLPSGIYIYTLKANGFTAQKKMVLMK